ncbi:alpha/beta hydrolase [Gordonia rubripertincta]|uniref:Alpha/beta hydrolase n=1 Tax=Gordonia rubripertincta TaxID=36822 RepID=A0AAW4G1I6_GORRU|nr:alpha/beta hydrolase [Gordonia rubripertincta]MBM7276973.1 alpha/beta hydrolase [Gordonia rubripertincta]
MPTDSYVTLPLDRPGRPAGPELLERRTKFSATEIDPSLAVTVDDTEYAGVQCRIIRGGERGTILYLHGGGFRMGSPEAYHAHAARLAAGAEVTVVLPRYRLAPESPYPAGLRDVLAAYGGVASTAGEPIVVAGDSAGAGLAATVVVAVRDGGIRTPDGLMLMSPWLDLHCSSPFYETATDPFFPAETARSARDDYLQGVSAADPMVSPLLAEHEGFPPTLIQVGAHEALVGDALDLARGLATADVACTLEVAAGQGHTWPLIHPDAEISIASVDSCVRFVRAIVDARRE